MIKIGFTDHKGNKITASYTINATPDQVLKQIGTLKQKASILKDNGETRPKKAFWSKKNLKT